MPPRRPAASSAAADVFRGLQDTNPPSVKDLDALKTCTRVLVCPVPTEVLVSGTQRFCHFDRNKSVTAHFERRLHGYLELMRRVFAIPRSQGARPPAFVHMQYGKRDSAMRRATSNANRRALFRDPDAPLSAALHSATERRESAEVAKQEQRADGLRKLGEEAWPTTVMYHGWDPEDEDEEACSESKAPLPPEHSCEKQCPDLEQYMLVLGVKDKKDVEEICRIWRDLIEENTRRAIARDPKYANTIRSGGIIMGLRMHRDGGETDRGDPEGDSEHDTHLPMPLAPAEAKDEIAAGVQEGVAVAVAAAAAAAATGPTRKRKNSARRSAAPKRGRFQPVAPDEPLHNQITLSMLRDIVINTNHVMCNERNGFPLESMWEGMMHLGHPLNPFQLFHPKYMHVNAGGVCSHVIDRRYYMYDDEQLNLVDDWWSEAHRVKPRFCFRFPDHVLKQPFRVCTLYAEDVQGFEHTTFPPKSKEEQMWLRGRQANASASSICRMLPAAEALAGGCQRDAILDIEGDRDEVMSAPMADIRDIVELCSRPDAISHESGHSVETVESFARDVRSNLEGYIKDHQTDVARAVREEGITQQAAHERFLPHTYKLMQKEREQACQFFEHTFLVPGASNTKFAEPIRLALDYYTTHWKDQPILPPFYLRHNNLSVLMQKYVGWMVELIGAERMIDPLVGIHFAMVQYSCHLKLPRYHILYFGRADTGKSNNLGVHEGRTIPGLFMSVTRETLGSGTSSKIGGDITKGQHETQPGKLGMNASGSEKDPQPNSEIACKTKEQLWEHRITTAEVRFNDDGQREEAVSTQVAPTGWIMITNMPKYRVAAPIKSRTISLDSDEVRCRVNDKMRRGMSELIGSTPSPDVQRANEAFIDVGRRIEFLLLLTMLFQRVVLLPEPGMHVEQMVVPKILNHSKLVLPGPLGRPQTRLSILCHINACLAANLEEFATPLGQTYRKRDPLGHFVPEPFEISHMLRLAPRLYGRLDGLVWSLGMVMSDYESLFWPKLRQSMVRNIFPELNAPEFMARDIEQKQQKRAADNDDDKEDDTPLVHRVQRAATTAAALAPRLPEGELESKDAPELKVDEKLEDKWDLLQDHSGLHFGMDEAEREAYVADRQEHEQQLERDQQTLQKQRRTWLLLKFGAKQLRRFGGPNSSNDWTHVELQLKKQKPKPKQQQQQQQQQQPQPSPPVDAVPAPEEGEAEEDEEAEETASSFKKRGGTEDGKAMLISQLAHVLAHDLGLSISKRTIIDALWQLSKTSVERLDKPKHHVKVLRFASHKIFIAIDYLIQPRSHVLLHHLKDVLQYDKAEPFTALFPTFLTALPRLIEFIPKPGRQLKRRQGSFLTVPMLREMVESIEDPVLRESITQKPVANVQPEVVTDSLQVLAYLRHLDEIFVPVEVAKEAGVFPEHISSMILHSQAQQYSHHYQLRRETLLKSAMPRHVVDSIMGRPPAKLRGYPECLAEEEEAVAIEEKEEEAPLEDLREEEDKQRCVTTTELLGAKNLAAVSLAACGNRKRQRRQQQQQQQEQQPSAEGENDDDDDDDDVHQKRARFQEDEDSDF